MTHEQDERSTKSSERQLWQAVLSQVITEATSGITIGESGKSRDRIIRQARNYVTVPNRDFDAVCHLAGLDPEAVRERLRQQLAQSQSNSTGEHHDHAL